jgi:hypothetical protein
VKFRVTVKQVGFFAWWWQVALAADASQRWSGIRSTRNRARRAADRAIRLAPHRMDVDRLRCMNANTYEVSS